MFLCFFSIYFHKHSPIVLLSQFVILFTQRNRPYCTAITMDFLTEWHFTSLETFIQPSPNNQPHSTYFILCLTVAELCACVHSMPLYMLCVVS